MTLSFRLPLLLLASLLSSAFPPIVQSAPSDSEIGVVVMHGKGGQPSRHVSELAAAMERAGFQVANLEMPWSGRRQYDVPISGAIEEVTNALQGFRAKGAKKVFLAGHSQGGLFALHYAGTQSVDGVLAITPGGQVDSSAFLSNLGSHLENARDMIKEGRGNERADFADYEGSKGTNPITTAPSIYLDWFDPSGAFTTKIFERVKPGTPVLYVAPTRDYPGLAKAKQRNFGALPANPKTRMYEPNSDHLKAPTASIDEAIAWIRQVAE